LFFSFEERNYIKHSFITLAKEEGLTFFSLSLRETKKKGNKQEKNDVIMSPKGKLSPSGKVIVLLLFSFFLPKEEIKRR
jgi:hypothetical protein